MKLFYRHILLFGILSTFNPVIGQIAPAQNVLDGKGEAAKPATGGLGAGSPVSSLAPSTDDPLKTVGGLLESLGLNNLDLSSLVDIDWKNNEQVLNLGGPEGKGKINLLASKKLGRDNATDDEKREVVKDAYYSTDQGKAQKKAENDQKNGRLNFFYAYGMQSEGDIVRPKWVMMFDNGFTAHRYFKLVQKSYQEYYKNNRHKCNEHPTPQIFIFPHGVGPDKLENVEAYTNFTGKVFFSPVDEKIMPVIPHQDLFGHLPSRFSP
ncbi:uncharacterized protein ACLA_043880 [Aspergillus clavatus NRRL 1]|uniref:Uncharacterized protein n=1 Tax=Aspergillus clavatus (strain ATCC 1007 / CBS 513.65 / DSM 816 / NCTC 3887 / NRRL 1 / QM 1276 / 107) TaxID=344612 RepID=A1C8N1_ASPCL|nr:uncharacterized protein ACLA_043880 [Aspergillus clavatus NRRL 1]EAW13668.1 conserved hypothetical protein [Aspergillus clavatus NRRL 1]